MGEGTDSGTDEEATGEAATGDAYDTGGDQGRGGEQGVRFGEVYRWYGNVKQTISVSIRERHKLQPKTDAASLSNTHPSAQATNTRSRDSG